MDPILVDVPRLLKGERVLVRPLVFDDARPLFEAIDQSRDHLAPWMPWVPYHRSVEDSLAYIIRSEAQWLLRERLAVGIFHAADGTLLGGSGLERMDWELRRFEIGYWLREDAQGHGYAREVVQLLARMAFDDLHANRLEIRMDPRNERSERVAQRLGFVFEGTLRNSAIDADGTPCDRQIYALVPDDYARLDWGRR